MASWVASKLVKEVVELVMRSIRFWMLARDAAAAATATTPAATPPKPKAKSTTIWKSSVKRKLHFDREKVPAHRSNTLEGILLRMGNEEANTISQRQGEYYSSHPVGGGGGGILDGPIPLLAALAIGGALAAFFIFQQATEARNNLENQLNVVNNSVNMAETDINALIASVNTAQTNANTNLNEATILCSANEAAGALPAANMATIIIHGRPRTDVGGEENLSQGVPRAIRPILTVEGSPRLHGHCMHSELIEAGQTCPLQ
eukprot:maker-scaffold1483_size38903-snap-gene-0.10 protein:Tk08073 transcript:maker-scaffold1483_size38903-snap-gene-0.10-mRNA-1 annotation:"hypothetical protein"